MQIKLVSLTFIFSFPQKDSLGFAICLESLVVKARDLRNLG